ncbi:MAG: hypothetical protein CK426_09335, partial [Legionella sp.]
MVKAIQHGQSLVLPSTYQSLTDVLYQAAVNYPHHGMRFIEPGEKETFLSHAKLLSEAQQYAIGLQQQGIGCGDFLLLELSNPLKFYKIFWACIINGIIAVPVSQPTSWKQDSPGWLKLLNIWRSLDKPKLVVDESDIHRYERLSVLVSCNDFKYLSFSDVAPDHTVESVGVSTHIDDVAVIQFSSGSTGSPKGVQLTHKNILTNSMALSANFQLTAEDNTFIWVPHTHDLGLFCQYFTSMIGCCNITIFLPSTFIRSPYLFLKKIAEYKGTWFASPNFGFDWIMRALKSEEVASLDLSSLRFMLNAAEPIVKKSIDQFLRLFSACGLKSTAFCFGYGLAEGTVGVATSILGEEPKIEYIQRKNALDYAQEKTYLDSIPLFHEGPPVPGVSIRITDEQGNTVDEGIEGEIRIKGQSVTRGYYFSEENGSLFDNEGWLCTGDLGFLSNGSLVVSGRLKDIICIRGVNYFSHDLEELVYSSGIIKRGSIVITGLHYRGQQEEVLVFVKHKSDWEQFRILKTLLTDSIYKAIGIDVAHVIPIKTLPKTTSGKIQRSYLSRQYIEGQYNSILKTIAEQLPSVESRSQATIEEIWDRHAKTLSQLKQLSFDDARQCLQDCLFALVDHWIPQNSKEDSMLHRGFFELGFSSMNLIELSTRLQNILAHQVQISIEVLFKYPTIVLLSRYIAAQILNIDLDLNDSGHVVSSKELFNE